MSRHIYLDRAEQGGGFTIRMFSGGLSSIMPVKLGRVR